MFTTLRGCLCQLLRNQVMFDALDQRGSGHDHDVAFSSAPPSFLVLVYVSRWNNECDTYTKNVSELRVDTTYPRNCVHKDHVYFQDSGICLKIYNKIAHVLIRPTCHQQTL